MEPESQDEEERAWRKRREGSTALSRSLRLKDELFGEPGSPENWVSMMDVGQWAVEDPARPEWLHGFAAVMMRLEEEPEDEETAELYREAVMTLHREVEEWRARGRPLH